MVAVRSTDQIALRNFINRGLTGAKSVEELVTLCDKQVRAYTQSSTKESIDLAKGFVGRCRKIDANSLLVALRAAGWAYLVAGRYREARESYLEARGLAIRQPLVRARIDRTLIDVYMYLGKIKESRLCATRAFATFRSIKATDDLARTQVNFANVLHRQDRHREAYRYYHRASEYFRSRGDQLSLALCWYNEGNTLVQLFDFDSAYQMYADARKIFQEHGHALHAYGCLYGLAWLHMLKGEFQIALRDLAECETFYRSGGQSRELILCQLDRAESYLGLNLLADSGRVAVEAAKGARKLGIKYEEAKAAFFQARAAIGLNQLRQARAQLRVARTLMEREGNKGFLAAIRVTEALIRDGGSHRHSPIAHAREALRSVQLPLWEAICDLEIAAEQTVDTTALDRLGKNPAVKTVPHLLAQYGVLRGDRAAGNGRINDAIRWWTRSAEVIDAVRMTLPPIEFRSSFLKGKRRDPFQRLIESETKRDARRAAVWVERGKTVGIWSPGDKSLVDNPARIRVQQSMSKLAQQVAAIASLSASNSGRRSARLAFKLPALTQLREQVRQELLALYSDARTDDTNPEFTHEMLAGVAQELPVIQFHVGDCDIHSFLSYRGECRAHTFVDGTRILDDLVARWRFFVECAPNSTADLRAVDLADETELIDRISSWLIEPLSLPESAEKILIIPDNKLFCLPWLALKWCGEPIIENFGILQAPSVRHYLHSRRPLLDNNTACIFVGEDSGLPWLSEEIGLIKRQLEGLSVKLFDPCLRQEWPDSSSARIWHFAGHALLRSDNPFYSALLLKDEQIFAADFRLMKNDVGVVTLAACRTAQQTGLPGEETSGLVRALLEMGARSVVAGGWAVSDRSTSVWMDSFYAALMRKASTVEAMNFAINSVRKQYRSAFHWAAFSVYGAG